MGDRIVSISTTPNLYEEIITARNSKILNQPPAYAEIYLLSEASTDVQIQSYERKFNPNVLFERFHDIAKI